MAVNEIGRLVIVAPGGDSGIGLGENYVGVVIEEGDVDGGRLVSSVTRWPEYAYSLIGRVCDGRAVQTVGADLVVQWKEVRPEAYIGLWREALKEAVSPREAADRFGVTVSLVVRGNVVRQAGRKRNFTTDPMQTFDGWAKRFADRISADADGYFEFELDLREPGALTDWDHMTGYADRSDEDPRNKREMRVRMTNTAKSVIGAADVPVAGTVQSEQGNLFA